MKYFLNRLTGKPPGGEFKVGDKVSFGGAIGTVISSSAESMWKLQVYFMGPHNIVGFKLDGSFFEWAPGIRLRFENRRTLVYKEAPVVSPASAPPPLSPEQLSIPAPEVKL